MTKGTVVKNVFDSGNILTITANTDASGSINYSGGIVTASDGTEISMTDYEGYNSTLKIDNGTRLPFNSAPTFRFNLRETRKGWQLHAGMNITTTNDTIVSCGHYNYIDGGADDDNIFVTRNNASLSSDPIEDILNSMTLEEKIGQMMMVGVYSTVISDQIKSLLNDSLIGSVILYEQHEKP